MNNATHYYATAPLQWFFLSTTAALFLLLRVLLYYQILSHVTVYTQYLPHPWSHHHETSNACVYVVLLCFWIGNMVFHVHVCVCAMNGCVVWFSSEKREINVPVRTYVKNEHQIFRIVCICFSFVLLFKKKKNQNLHINSNSLNNFKTFERF